MMKYSLGFLIGTLYWIGLLFISCKSGDTTDKLIINPDDDLTTTLEKILINEEIPGIVAAIADSSGIRVIEAAGVRKFESPDLMSIDDKLHLGSCTKAMTSAMIATLVQEGKMRWDMSIIDVFPELIENIHPTYQDATVHELCTHRSGLAANAEDWWLCDEEEVVGCRHQLMIENLSEQPESKRGDFLYSNLGYMIAGHMAEQVTGKPWETLMQERLFDKLNMTSAGFGPPGKEDEIQEPWGHRKLIVTNWIPSQSDNAKALGPAGTVHCSIEDWASFVIDLTLKPSSAIFDQDQRNKLLKPTGEYACGWGVSEKHWATGSVYGHSGSNTMWLSVVRAAPDMNRAYLVVSNSMGSLTEKVCDDVLGKLISLDKGEE